MQSVIPSGIHPEIEQISLSEAAQFLQKKEQNIQAVTDQTRVKYERLNLGSTVAFINKGRYRRRFEKNLKNMSQ